MHYTIIAKVTAMLWGCIIVTMLIIASFLDYITVAKVAAKLCGAAFLATLMSFALRSRYDILKRKKVFFVYWMAIFSAFSITLIAIDAPW